MTSKGDGEGRAVRSIVVAVLAVVVVALAAAVLRAGARPSEQADMTGADPNVTAPAEAVVESSPEQGEGTAQGAGEISAVRGGTVRSPLGVTVTIGPAVLAEDALVEISEGDRAPALPELAEPLSPIVELSASTQLRAPVSVTFELDPALLPGGGSGDVVGVLHYDPQTDSWVDVPSLWDGATGTVSFTTDHFSWWRVVLWPFEKVLDVARTVLYAIGERMWDEARIWSAPTPQCARDTKVSTTMRGGAPLKVCAEARADGSHLLKLANNRTFAQALPRGTRSTASLQRMGLSKRSSTREGWAEIAIDTAFGKLGSVVVPGRGSVELELAADATLPLEVGVEPDVTAMAAEILASFIGEAAEKAGRSQDWLKHCARGTAPPRASSTLRADLAACADAITTAMECAEQIAKKERDGVDRWLELPSCLVKAAEKIADRKIGGNGALALEELLKAFSVIDWGKQILDVFARGIADHGSSLLIRNIEAPTPTEPPPTPTEPPPTPTEPPLAGRYPVDCSVPGLGQEVHLEEPVHIDNTPGDDRLVVVACVVGAGAAPDAVFLIRDGGSPTMLIGMDEEVLVEAVGEEEGVMFVFGAQYDMDGMDPSCCPSLPFDARFVLLESGEIERF